MGEPEPAGVMHTPDSATVVHHCREVCVRTLVHAASQTRDACGQLADKLMCFL